MKGKVIRALLVEDNPVDAIFVEKSLTGTANPTFQLSQAEQLAAGLSKLAEGTVDVLLLDLDLPDSQDLATFRTAQAAAPQLPIVVLSRESDEELAVEAVQAGAQDYLVKGRYDRELLTRSLRYAIERKRAQHALSELGQRMTHHVSNSPLAVIEWGPALDIIRWSGEAERIFGWRQAEALGKRRDDLGLVHQEDREKFAQVFDGLCSGAEPKAFSATRNLHKDGSVMHCEWYNSALLEASGRPRSILSLVHDISQRRRAEQALSLANRQLRQLTADLLRSQDHERRRIARELHDSTAQTLAALSMNLNRLQRAESEPPRRQALLAESIELADASSRELRTVAYLLHPPLLDEIGLVGALRNYAEGFQRRTGIAVDLQIPSGWDRLDGALELALVRIVQEGLANVHRHSGSRLARIRLEQDRARVRLVLEDEGRGLPPELRQGDRAFAGFGVGILDMRERAEQLGGSLEIASAGDGTRVAVTLPRGTYHGEPAHSGCR